jgi:hypothetical protein
VSGAHAAPLTTFVDKSCYDPRNPEGIMRLASLAVALTLSGCVTAAADQIEVTAAVPGGIAVTSWCWRFPDRGCRHQADDAARARCLDVGGKARFVRSALLQRTYRHGEKGLYLYDCSR